MTEGLLVTLSRLAPPSTSFGVRPKKQTIGGKWPDGPGKQERVHSMRIQYSIIFVSDMARSVVFYKDVIGMPLKFESPGWTEFNTDGATWALHICDSGADNMNGVLNEIPGRCRPGIQVSNLETFHSRMVEKDVPCVQEPTETFGTRIAQYVDPDGLVFSVGESTSDE